MNLSSFILLSTLAVSTAFSPAPTAKWGVRNTQQISQTQLFEDSVDTNFEGVDIVRLLGYNRVNKLIKKGQRNSQSSGLKLIIAGAPASGKGTQCELIKKEYGVVHLSTGDMLRAAVAAGTEVGTAAKEYMNAGKLVPDEVIIGVVSSSLLFSNVRKRDLGVSLAGRLI